MQVPRLSGMLRAFTTQQGNVDIAAQYRQRGLQLEGRRRSTADAHVSVPLMCNDPCTPSVKTDQP